MRKNQIAIQIAVQNPKTKMMMIIRIREVREKRDNKTKYLSQGTCGTTMMTMRSMIYTVIGMVS